MFGGAPNSMPTYMPMNVGQPYPVAQGHPLSAPQPGYQQAQPVPFPSQGWKPQAPVQQVAAPRLVQPTFRAKVDEPPATPTLKTIAMSLPPPEAVGIAPPSVATCTNVVDWNIARARLNSLGASFSLVRLNGGAFRMVVTLPTANPNQAHLVDVVADTEAVAVATALQRAEQWGKQ